MRTTAPRQAGFTLIELLVVIAIIALLVAILLPVLGKARRSAQLAQSLSNLSQIATASASYAAEHKDEPPIDSLYAGALPVGHATWSFGGKFCDEDWAGIFTGNHDLAPESRPLNPYLYPGDLHPDVTGTPDRAGPARPATPAERTDLDLPVFKSPRDLFSSQRPPFGTPLPTMGSYDDVGTSYHYNRKWVFQLRAELILTEPEAFATGRLYLRSARYFVPDRFVMYTDQIGDLIRGEHATGGVDTLPGEFGGDNTSLMAFNDGHVTMETVVAGEDFDEGYNMGFLLPDPD